MFTKYRKIAGVLSGLMMTPLAWSSELQDVKFAELPGDRVEIRLVFDEAPSSPQGYTIEQPARIVLDFADVENALAQKKFNMDMGSVSSAVVVAGGNRTRLIVNMNTLEPYATRVEGTDLVMEVGGSAKALAAVEPQSTVATAASPVLAKPKNRFDKSVSEIQNIDFRRGDAGEGKVIVQLSNPGVSIDVEEVAGGIEVGFLQTDLPDALRRKLDVTDFATPVQMIDATTGSLRTVLKIDANGEYDYLAYQADNEYVVSIKPLTKAEIEEKRAKFAYTGEKLSLNFQNIEVRSVLQLIADFTDLNLVASDTVKGSITLRLDNVPWDQALELVLKTKGLDKRQVGNVLMVAPAAEIAERERQELATQKQLEELAPLRTEYIRVRYANARELFELFIPEGGLGGQSGSGGNQRNSTGTILSDRGHAIVDERTNSIILTDTEEKINDFRRVIEQIDVPIRQVMIEARIVIANNNFRKELGSRINFASQSRFKNGQIGYSGKMDELFNNSNGEAGTVYSLGDNDPDDYGETITDVDSRAVDLGVIESFGNFTMGVVSGDVLLGLEISALEESGFAEIVSQPKVITGDKQQASIESGTEIAYQEASASGATTVAFKEAVLKLDVTPQITPDDNIIMDLKINQDNVGELTNAGIPTIDVTELNTQVLVADGQTVVLGGIFQNNVVTGQSKVPLLGDIPVLGRLFRKDTKSEDKKELIIFVTPRIMSSTLTNN
ncbi:type IV pilus secretin PilQ family protein [Marinagarivorans cellulosilyticus]|uniref:Type IV pilus assembly protein PilQ n=1 Tax=Marinagarivorans cellulosilyticus TaxID=2721545 RepID=A0AAN1WEE8_9GAMM|nr:type IV pilus secretin PilQ family protein [Marinagarivorans cellulosilyticus]BCD96071.1 type IV pilus assembly protein PilQ [Marinagarivorans cellulosilyticus]